ncbi:DUF1361 domain-containing protein [Nocardia sp. NBC_01377]|uniref:DUF1361 domain-containing protein n=1 Tax=Nocardia sp. NBC_01377 TaxID=2903595 RepID=UPI003869D813
MAGMDVLERVGPNMIDVVRRDFFWMAWNTVLAWVPVVYAVFLGSGFLAYYLALAAMRRYLEDRGLGRWCVPVTLGLHLLCAVGVFLGRWVRLNSWEPVVEPVDTFERTLLALTWSWAPVLIAAVFVATAVGHFVTGAVVEAAVASGRRGIGLVRATVSGTA